MSEDTTADGFVRLSGENRIELTAFAVAVGLLAFSLGYETGSVLAGEPLEVLWLVPVVTGTATVFIALSGRDDED